MNINGYSLIQVEHMHNAAFALLCYLEKVIAHILIIDKTFFVEFLSRDAIDNHLHYINTGRLQDMFDLAAAYQSFNKHPRLYARRRGQPGRNAAV